jgi:hypothetical protein
MSDDEMIPISTGQKESPGAEFDETDKQVG